MIFLFDTPRSRLREESLNYVTEYLIEAKAPYIGMYDSDTYEYIIRSMLTGNMHSYLPDKLEETITNVTRDSIDIG